MLPFSNSEWLQNLPLFTLLLVCVPLTTAWGYALYDCAREGLGWMQRRAVPVTEGARVQPMQPMQMDDSPLEPATWALLLVLAGWFGALAYLAVVVLPRRSPTWRRLLFSQP